MTEREKGLEKKVIRSGNGPKPIRGQLVTIDCTGLGKNNDLSRTFWSTNYETDSPFSFVIGEGNVIKGLDEGVLEMQLGEIARLKYTPDYAFGANGYPAWGIQPNLELEFQIELLHIDVQTGADASSGQMESCLVKNKRAKLDLAFKEEDRNR